MFQMVFVVPFIFFWEVECNLLSIIGVPYTFNGPDSLHGPMSGPLLHWVLFMVPMVFLVIINSLMCILCYTTIVKIKKNPLKK